MRKDLYFSCDIEADGPIPGPFSMSSIGLCVCGLRQDGEAFVPIDVELETFYAELKPISESFDPQAMAVSGLDRDDLIRNGKPPKQAMQELEAWVEELAGRHQARPVFAAYPLGYDWMFSYWYMSHFARSPFGFSSAIDMKTLYSQKFGVPICRSTKRFMPKRLLSGRKHTHNALDDAIGQGEMFQKMMAE